MTTPVTPGGDDASHWPTRPFLIASLPAGLVGAWSVGRELLNASPDETSIWQWQLLLALGIAPDSGDAVAAALGLGAAFFLPLLLVSLLTARAWAEVFARVRDRPLDDGWWLAAWLFTLLLPAGISPVFAALGLSFGYVFGALVFGGTGRHLVHPALLGIAFLSIGYPGLMGTGWVPGTDIPSSWAVFSASGAYGLDRSLTEVLAGGQVGALGASSAFAAFLGFAYLVARRVVPGRLLAGACAGAALASLAAGHTTWYWHIALGNIVLLASFYLADPTLRPVARSSQWVMAMAFGALTVALRSFDPERPEGSVAALLLVSLLAPFIDRAQGAPAARRRQRRPESER